MRAPTHTIGAGEREAIREGRMPAPKPQYGMAASVRCESGRPVPSIADLMRKYDYHGVYERPSIDLQTGTVQKDAAGAVLFDRVTGPTRQHLTYAAKGWSLITILDGAPAVETEAAR